MNNKKIKVITTILMSIMLIGMITSVFAGDLEIPEGTPGDTSATLNTSSSVIIGVIQAIGIAIAVIMLIILAVRYLSAGPSDKADVKKTAGVYVLGAVLLFAASGVLGIIQAFAKETIK